MLCAEVSRVRGQCGTKRKTKKASFNIGAACAGQETCADNAISKELPNGIRVICYAGALCFAVRLVALGSENATAGFELPIRKT